MPRASEDTVDTAPTPEVAFGEDTIVFRHYPYPSASVFPAGEVHADDVAEIVSNFQPPVVRTKDDDFLVLPQEGMAEARAFAERRGIPIVRRVDVWTLILEPFTDVAVDRRLRRGIRQTLRRCGLSPMKVFLLRWRTSFRVEFIHCVHWSWQHHGLADLLDAVRPMKPAGRRDRFYAQAMQIAALGYLLDDGEPDPAEPLRQRPAIVPGARPVIRR